LSCYVSIPSPLPLSFFFHCSLHHHALHSFPTRRSSDLLGNLSRHFDRTSRAGRRLFYDSRRRASALHTNDGETNDRDRQPRRFRSEEHTSELQSRGHLVCRLLLEKKKIKTKHKQKKKKI